MQVARSLSLGLVVAAIALAAACGTGSSSSVNTTPSANADAVRDQVVATMNGVDSFRAVFSSGDSSFTTEILEPSTYRVVVAGTLAGQDEPTQMESLYIGETLYRRTCRANGASCDEWATRERDGALGLGTYDPRWPVVALEMADDLSVSDGVLRGGVNQIRAIFAHSRRLQEEAGLAPRFTRVCGGSETPVGIRDGTVVSTPQASDNDDLECRDLTYEESLENQEPGLSFIDKHPSRIEAEFDPASHLLTAFTITIADQDEDVSSGEPNGKTHTLTFTYSKYNDVTIEAPE